MFLYATFVALRKVSRWTTIPVLLSSALFLFAMLTIQLQQRMRYWEYAAEVFTVEHQARLNASQLLMRQRQDAAQAVSQASQDLTAAWEELDELKRELPPEAFSSSSASACSCPDISAASTSAPLLPARSHSSNLTEVLRYSPDLGDQLEELNFKIFVYPLPGGYHADLKRAQKRCITDQYGTEIKIHETLLQSPLRTTDPTQAEFFYVPIYGECMLFKELKQNGKKGWETTNRWYLDALNIIKREFPYFNRTQGRDHVWVFPGARGPHIFRDWKKHIRRNIFLTPEGDRSLGEQFNTWKDIVIPGLEHDEKFWSGKLRRQNVTRDIFAFFKGTIKNKEGASYSRGIRIKMKEALQGIHDVVFSEPSSKLKYAEEMRRSRFCLCPRGWSPWTLRAYQAMMVGCIPVILADEIEFPYENLIDWSKLTVKILEKDAERVLDILRAIPEETVRSKQDAISQVWEMVTYPKPPKLNDAFHSIMRELGRKRRQMKTSSISHWT